MCFSPFFLYCKGLYGNVQEGEIWRAKWIMPGAKLTFQKLPLAGLVLYHFRWISLLVGSVKQ